MVTEQSGNPDFNRSDTNSRVKVTNGCRGHAPRVGAQPPYPLPLFRVPGSAQIVMIFESLMMAASAADHYLVRPTRVPFKLV